MGKKEINLKACLGTGRWFHVVLAVSLLVGGQAAYGQARRAQQPDFHPLAQPNVDPLPHSVLIAPNKDYRIGPGDVLDVHVEDAPEMTRTLRVSANGTFPMPIIGDIVAQKKTAYELAKDITQRLRGKYLVEPIVDVVVREINSHSFFIQGAVRRPGVYQIEGRPSLLTLITVAGGLADNYGSTAYVISQAKTTEHGEPAAEPPAPSAPAGEEAAAKAPEKAEDQNGNEDDVYEMSKVNINGLLRGRFEQNVKLEAGCIVNIPTTDVFFVAGEVKSPGSFPQKEGTTLRQAISLAQGLTFNAQGGNGTIFREEPNTGNRKEIKIDISAVMSGKADDVAIMANDIIIVPNSRMKTVGSALVTAFGMSAVRLPGRGY